MQKNTTLGLIIVDHGSRRKESNLMLEDFVCMFRKRHNTFNIVEPAHMELAEPSIASAFAKCVAQGASRIVVAPYFLAPGKHWNKDIPHLAALASAQHNNIPFLVASPIGLHELMTDIIASRIEYCLAHSEGKVEECATCHGTRRCRFSSAD